jgi:predicted nuclease of predicted toxin-antitoxin system
VNYVVDANLSPRLAQLLRDAGHDAVHVRDIGLRTASDDEIIDYAISTDRIVISHDTDFGTLLAYRELSKPSFILIRSSDPVDVDDQARLVVANLDAMSDDLEAGAIAVFARGRLRIRRLPLRG